MSGQRIGQPVGFSGSNGNLRFFRAEVTGLREINRHGSLLFPEYEAAGATGQARVPAPEVPSPSDGTDGDTSPERDDASHFVRVGVQNWPPFSVIRSLFRGAQRDLYPSGPVSGAVSPIFRIS